jgi:hypothetical protein
VGGFTANAPYFMSSIEITAKSSDVSVPVVSTVLVGRFVSVFERLHFRF